MKACIPFSQHSDGLEMFTSRRRRYDRHVALGSESKGISRKLALLRSMIRTGLML
jgi:hypothetical protein